MKDSKQFATSVGRLLDRLVTDTSAQSEATTKKQRRSFFSIQLDSSTHHTGSILSCSMKQ